MSTQYGLYTTTYSANTTVNNAAAVRVSRAGFVRLFASGSFGSGTLTLNIAAGGTSNYYASNETLTAAGVRYFPVKAGDLVKVSLAGATNPTIVFTLD
jgi:hypothetical protein